MIGYGHFWEQWFNIINDRMIQFDNNHEINVDIIWENIISKIRWIRLARTFGASNFFLLLFPFLFFYMHKNTNWHTHTYIWFASVYLLQVKESPVIKISCDKIFCIVKNWRGEGGKMQWERYAERWMKTRREGGWKRKEKENGVHEWKKRGTKEERMR